jgi:hypothetical protein
MCIVCHNVNINGYDDKNRYHFVIISILSKNISKCDLCIVEASDLYKFAKFKLKTPLFFNVMNFKK